MVEYEEPSIVNAPGFVGKTVFDPATKKAVDKQVKVDKRYITNEFGPMVLTPGETLEVLDEKEQGELLYIKVITDNPYANVYLELDNYRNSQDGETHAELLYDQRTSNAEGQFYIETDGSNGKGFPMVWNPQTSPSAYKANIKLKVSNPLRTSRDSYGFNLKLRGRAGQPTPIQPLHIGGGSFVHAGLAGASLDTIAAAIANPVGGSAGYTVDSVVNQGVFDSDGDILAEGNLYAGRAGKPFFQRNPASIIPGQLRGVQSHNGIEILGAEQAPASALSPVQITATAAANFPGSQDNPSTSVITFQGDNAAANTGDNGVNGYQVGDRVFIRNGGTVHFPGEVTNVAITLNDTVKVTVKPGFKTALSTVTMPHPDGVDASESICFGKVAALSDVSPDIVIKKVVVRRKRKVTYEG